MDTPSTPPKSRKKRDLKQEEQQAAPSNARAKGTTHGAVIPLMLRPKISQKACAERIAQQMERKRSQLDPTFYLTGALLTGVEHLGPAEQIGTWTRKDVAAYLKSAFTPLFELLYEQNELPLAFALLINRGATVSAPAMPPDQGQPLSGGMPYGTQRSTLYTASPTETSLPSFLPAEATVSLDGFPEDI